MKSLRKLMMMEESTRIPETHHLPNVREMKNRQHSWDKNAYASVHLMKIAKAKRKNVFATEPVECHALNRVLYCIIAIITDYDSQSTNKYIFSNC